MSVSSISQTPFGELASKPFPQDQFVWVSRKTNALFFAPKDSAAANEYGISKWDAMIAAIEMLMEAKQDALLKPQQKLILACNIKVLHQRLYDKDYRREFPLISLCSNKRIQEIFESVQNDFQVIFELISY